MKTESFHFSDSAKATATFEAISFQNKWGGYVIYAELASEPMIGDPMMTGPDGRDLKPQEEVSQTEEVIGTGASGCQLL